MALRIVGAGLGRTGTHSLKLALEKLTGEPCYHMAEVFQHPEHVSMWREAAEGRMPDWDKLLTGYSSAVDWPASAYWRELSEVYPDAPVLLSTRDSEGWWKSASATIFPTIAQFGSQMPEWYAMVLAMFKNRFVEDLSDKNACIAAFERHNAEVRASVPSSRLIEWKPGDDWAPLCAALGLPIPDEPYPRSNTTEEFIARIQQPSPSASIDTHPGR